MSIRRHVSFITLCAFLLSALTGDYAYPLPQDGIPKQSFNLNDFKLLEYLEYIKDSYISPKQDKLIIHIQDAHCNYNAHKAIYNILDYLNKTYSIDSINLEGGEGAYDFSGFFAIKDDSLRNKVIDYLIKEGELSGAESYGEGRSRRFRPERILGHRCGILRWDIRRP